MRSAPSRKGEREEKDILCEFLDLLLHGALGHAQLLLEGDLVAVLDADNLGGGGVVNRAKRFVHFL